MKSSKFQVPLKDPAKAGPTGQASSKRNGFTLTEMLVSMVIFTILIGGIIGVFVSSLRTQRYYLASQKLLDQSSYIMEYMSRAIRMAKKQTSDSPLICITEGYNYENIGGNDLGIRFIKVTDGTQKCLEFYLAGPDNDQIYQEIDGGSFMSLTSDDLKVNSLKFYIDGEYQGVFGAEDPYQPKVTIYLDIEVKNINPSPPRIKIQTTVSQRDLDIIE